MKKKIITNKAIEGTASILAKRFAKSFFTPPHIEGKVAERKKDYSVHFCCTDKEAGEVMDVLHIAFPELKFKLEEK